MVGGVGHLIAPLLGGRVSMLASQAGHPLAEIGSLLSISEARVSQLRRAALDRLARAVEPSLRWAA